MKKLISGVSIIFILLIFFQITTKSPVEADWWSRSGERNIEPINRDRNLPPPAQPTNPPSQPTVAPTSPPTGGTPSDGGGGGGSSSNENPCAQGKSYVGPYCGWSPDTTKSGGGGGGGGSGARVGGPQVLGLSNTSSSDVYLSDIILLAGILCLALYAKSKLTTNGQLH